MMAKVASVSTCTWIKATVTMIHFSLRVGESDGFTREFLKKKIMPIPFQRIIKLEILPNAFTETTIAIIPKPDSQHK